MVEKVGTKVSLRQATSDDLEAIYYWKYIEEKQEAKKWNGPYIPETPMTRAEFIADWEDDRELYQGVPSQLVITVDGKFIGTVGAYWVDERTNWLETGIVVYDEAYWNGGYGTEAYSLWIDYLFEKTSLHRLGMSTWSGNKRMMRVAEKLGMKLEAQIRQARIVDGELYDAIKMGILRREWEACQS